jgi:hypothetical protein
LKQTVLRKSTSVIRPRHINTEASVIVFRESKDAMDATLEKSTDTSGAGDRKPKKPYRRPWLVQVNGSFLVKALKDITGNAFESETLLL